jgi:hypothetical protein
MSTGTRQDIDITLLKPDINNPRITEYINANKNPTPEDIFLALGGAAPDRTNETGTSFRALRESIRAYGTLINPIIVNKNAENKFTVVEGNTRLAIYWEFKSKGVPGEWEKIPAIIHQDLDETSMHEIRLQAHLVGTRDWTPYAKGKYLYQLFKEEKIDIETIIGICGGKSDQIKDFIKAYEVMKDYYEPLVDADNFDHTRFSGFVELQSPKIQRAIEEAGFDMHDVASWFVKPTKIKKNEHVRKLAAILTNPNTLQMFLADGSTEAIKMIESPISKQLDEFSTTQLMEEVQQRLLDLTDNKKIEKFKENKKTDFLDTVKDLRDCIIGFCYDVELD